MGASICFSMYMSWITVHIVYPNSKDNASPNHIFGEAVRVFDQFELYYYKASEKIRRRASYSDAGILRTFQMYTSNFASNLHLAKNLAGEGKPYPALPPRAKNEVCFCRHRPPPGYGGRGWRLLQVPEGSEQNYTEHLALLEEGRPWERQVCMP